MGLQPTPWSLSLIAAVLLAIPLSYVAWQRRHKPGAKPLAVMASGTGLAAGGVVLSMVVTGFDAATYWRKFALTGVGLATVAWFVFVLEYSGRENFVTDRLLAALAVEPLLVVVLTWTNGVHGLIWDSYVGPTPAGITVTDYGAAFWIHTVYTYALLFVGVVVLVRMLPRTRDLYRGQVAALVTGVVAPPTANLVYLASLYFDENVIPDVTPVGFSVATGAFFFALYRFDLMNISPVAHDTVVDNIRDGVVVLDRTDHVIEINPMAKRILGIDTERAVGQHASDVLSIYPGLYERYRDVDQIQEEIGLDDGNQRRFFHIQVSPLYDSHDRQVGRLFLVHEITDQKRRQQELQRQNQRLDQFASLVSHDLRNPLNVADGYVDLAQDTGDVEYLDKVKDSHERMGQLIDDVLALARQGQTITETEPVRFQEIAEAAWANVDTADATLDVRTDGSIDANYGRLLRVFENLYRNAVEHAGRDVEIRVGAFRDAGTDGGEVVGFYVEDDGPGIDPEERDRVLEDGYTNSEEGTGLGLSIVSSIVQAHGWSIRVRNGSDGGARFEITGVDPATDGGERRRTRADGSD